jgi:GNAT superfamily N-acetyltransferase
VTYQVELLADQDLTAFRSGNPELDDWLVRSARSATGHGVRTYVLIDQDGSVCGYFAIAPHLLARDHAPARLARGAPEQIPAILLAKLALDASLQGRGLGADLLVAALQIIVAAARRAGGRVVVVDAIDDEARTFYEHHDFQVVPGSTHRLVMRLSTAAKALGVPWP